MFDVRQLNIAIEMWGVAFCLIGAFSTILFSQLANRYKTIVFCGFLLELVACAGDAFAGIFRGHAGTAAWVATHVGNLATFVGNLTLVAALVAYLCRRLEDSSDKQFRWWRLSVNAMAAVMCVLAAIGLFYTIDEGNIYHRSSWYWVPLVWVVAVNAINVILAIRGRKKLGAMSFGCLMLYSLSPLVAALAQMFVYGLNFVIIVGVINMVIVFFEARTHTARLLIERTEELAKARLEVSESRIQVMVSQIQPHFLFNTLDTIYGLIDDDTKQAKAAVASFSRYLRTNLDSLRHTAPVPIEREMEHVRTYLELERMSDQERLEYELDIGATGFAVPALSVQTLAENAVKHGLGKRECGGKVIVRTREHQGEYTVAIIDDGVGFDVNRLTGRGGVGLENTRQRLKAMCDGTLEVTSEPGKGTVVVMHLPKDASLPTRQGRSR